MDNLRKRSNEMPQQRTPEWLEIRKTGFGGSEIATLMGKNKYKTGAALIKEKLGLIQNKFKGNDFTNWGIVHENNTKLITEKIFGIKIEEFNILFSGDHKFCSPDGIGKYDDIIILFEFKAPFLRMPDGHIPLRYIYQIQHSLGIIEPAEYAVYVDNYYKLCSLDCMYRQSYNHKYPFGQRGRPHPEFDDILACGVIIVEQKEYLCSEHMKEYAALSELLSKILYSKAEIDKFNDAKNHYAEKIFDKNYTADDDIFVSANIQENEIHFGLETKKIDRKALAELFKILANRCCECMPTCTYIDPVVSPDKINLPDIILDAAGKSPVLSVEDIHKHFTREICRHREQLPQDVKIIGFIPWKLYICDIISEHRNNDIIADIDRKIQDIIPKMKMIINCTDKNEKNMLFTKYIKNNNI